MGSCMKRAEMHSLKPKLQHKNIIARMEIAPDIYLIAYYARMHFGRDTQAAAMNEDVNAQIGNEEDAAARLIGA